MHDLRPELLRPHDAVGRPLTSRHYLGVVFVILSPIGLLALGDIPPVVAVLGVAFAGACLPGFRALRHRPPVITRATPLGPVTQIAVSPWRVVGAASMLAVLGAAIGVGAFYLRTAAPALAVVVGLVAAVTLWSALVTATASDTRGVVRLSSLGLSYAGPQFRSAIVWDDVAAVSAEERRGLVRIALRHETPVEISRIPGRFGRPRTGAPDVLTVAMGGMALLPTDLARVVAHYARFPAVRSELGTDAALARIGAIAAKPVGRYTLELDVDTPATPGAPRADGDGAGRRNPLKVAAVREGSASAAGFLNVDAGYGALLIAAGAWWLADAWGDMVPSALGAAFVVLGLVKLALTLHERRRAQRMAAQALASAEGRPIQTT